MENKKVGFRLLALKTEQYATFEDDFSEGKKSNLTTHIDYRLNREHKQIGVFSSFTFEHSKKAFIKIQVSCHFEISPDSWELFIRDSKIIFPKDFLSHLSMLTIGSARGVLHAKTEGTIFNKFLLPTINVTALVKKDVEFELT